LAPGQAAERDFQNGETALHNFWSIAGDAKNMSFQDFDNRLCRISIGFIPKNDNTRR
jgi:hypothetical protein